MVVSNTTGSNLTSMQSSLFISPTTSKMEGDDKCPNLETQTSSTPVVVANVVNSPSKIQEFKGSLGTKIERVRKRSLQYLGRKLSSQYDVRSPPNINGRAPTSRETVRKRFSTSALDDPAAEDRAVNIKNLEPKCFRRKTNSIHLMNFTPTTCKAKEDESEVRRHSLRSLTRTEVHMVENVREKTKRQSVFYVSFDEKENEAAPKTSTMDKTPKRQKVARCMVRYGDLNFSRPRTETGQPVSFSEKRRCKTMYEPKTSRDFHRTNSDPDLFRLASRENLANDGDEDSTAKEVYTTYTAVGSHEDIHSLSTQMSVHEILTSFEEKKALKPPVPKPRKLDKSDSENREIPKPVVKPKPSPRPKPKRLSNDKQCAGNDSPPSPLKQNVKECIDAPIKQKSVESPAVPCKPAPKVAPKPISPRSKSPLVDKVTIHKQDSFPTQINIEYKVSGSNPAINATIPPQQNSSESIEGGLKKKVKGIKQKSTKTSTSSLGELEAYSVVQITDSTEESDKTNGEEPVEYDEVPEEYLQPIEAINGNSVEGAPSLPPPKTPTHPPPKTPSHKAKRNNFKQKKQWSKSVVEKKNPTVVDDRRTSLPSIHPENCAIYSDIDDDESARPRAASEFDDGRIYLSADAVISPAVSDDEGWHSDEFDSSSGEEEEPTPKLPHLEGTKKKLYSIVTEILTTERAYVRRLHLLDQVFNKRFLEEAKEDPTVITDKVVEEIFPYLSPIYKFHSSTVLPEIEQRIKEWESKEKIGDIFKRLGHYLLLYSEYVKNFDHAITTLGHWLRKSPRFAAIVDELQRDPISENLTLQSHMLEPVQRVPRYKLLLADYLKRLPEDSPDRKESQDALKVISKAAENSNNSMKENEKFKKLLEIEDRIAEGMRGESLVMASRVFLKEGDLVKLAARSGNRMSRTVILFSDMLLCGQQTTTGKLKVKVMDLFHLNIVDNDPDLPELAFRVKSKQKVLDLLASSEVEMSEWVEAIRKAVDEQELKIGSRIQQSIAEADLKIDDKSFQIGEQAPPWVKDQLVSMCMLCASKFGIIHRKHHCRGCGRVVCGKCSNYNAKMAYSDDKVLRVCFSCAKKLSVISDQPQTSAVLDRLNESVMKRSSTPSDMHGEVFWKAPGKEYKKEWLFLSEFVLYGQKKKQDVKAHFTMPVLGYEVEMQPKLDDMESPQLYSMKLHKQNKKEFTFFIASDNKQLLTSWFNHLQCAVQFKKYEPDNDPENPEPE